MDRSWRLLDRFESFLHRWKALVQVSRFLNVSVFSETTIRVLKSNAREAISNASGFPEESLSSDAIACVGQDLELFYFL